MATETKTEKSGREVSSIQFPYLDLEDAISVARAMWKSGGQSYAKDQLAGTMGQSPISGNFVMKTQAARLFGLVDFSQSKFMLTQLGYEIVDTDPSRVAAAKAAAFLKVPLYARAYEAFRGKPLPPRGGLEQCFVDFGVSFKQKDKARQAFERSAEQAGYFATGRERLVPPIVAPSPPLGGNDAPAPMDQPQNQSTQRSASGSALALDELILGLLKRLPPSGEKWDLDKRVRWLRTLNANLEEVYPWDDDQGKRVTIALTTAADDFK